MLASVGVVLIAVLMNLAISHRARLIGVAVLLIPQVYLPGLPISLAVIWTLVTCLVGLTTSGRSRAGSPLVVVLLVLLIVTATSLLWALPTGIYLGSVTVFYGGVFLLWLREMIVVARDEPFLLDRLMLWLIPGVIVQSLLTILFRLSPAIEVRFHHSALSPILMGPVVTRLYTDLPNNVIDPAKAGGFFPNGNPASLFGGVVGLLLCVAARRTAKRWVYLCAALSFTAGYFTGSKSGLLLGIGVVVLVLILPRIAVGSASLGALALVFGTLAFAFGLPFILERVAPGVYASSDYSYSTRGLLWARATAILRESPLLGTGFGSWFEQVGRVGSRSDLPPHNYFISTWVNSGFLAVVLVCLFILLAVVLGLRTISEQSDVRGARTACMAFSAALWVFLHGIGDNTGFFGDRYDMIMIGIAIGYLYAMRRGSTAVPSTVSRPTEARAFELPQLSVTLGDLKLAERAIE